LLLMDMTLLWSCWYSLLLHSYLYKLRNQIWNCLLSSLTLYILVLLIRLFLIAVVPQIIEQIESFIMQWRLSVNKMVIENENELDIG
jgi:predicted PurR-regulated permease PerM